ncbi:MAG TPA: SufD family Fe-S cluster assembly protein [Thermoplasmata archaeon]|nr:SufD family Fe-S cluster assembly protein [Thermoplasmata archaeon]
MAASVARHAEWVSPQAVRQLSSTLGDPAAVAASRIDAYDRFQNLPLEPNPLYRGYGYFSNVDLTGIRGDSQGEPATVPPPLPGAIRIVHDAAGTRAELPTSLTSSGIGIQTLTELWKIGADGGAALLKDAEEPTDRLTALSTVLLNRGYRLEIPDGFTDPVRVQELTILTRPQEALSVRRSVRAGRGSQLLLSEETYSTAPPDETQRLVASSTHVEVGSHAKVVFLSVHAPDLRTVSVYRRSANVGEAGRLAWMWNGLGGFRTKLRNRTALTGTGSDVVDLQTFYGARDQSYDSSVELTHVATDTHGQSITRGVFTDDARGMSRGLVRIEHEARRTLSYISEHAMLLSRGSRSDTLPILEILCRDVKATHSTSVHPVDPEQVFYLESRGIGEPEAIRMIGEGFLAYVHERAPIADMRETLYPSLEARWNGEPLTWKGATTPILPALSVAGTDSSPEWRFDAKLR